MRIIRKRDRREIRMLVPEGGREGWILRRKKKNKEGSWIRYIIAIIL